MNRICLVLLAISLAACSSAPEFNVSLQTTPLLPIPSKPLDLAVTLTGAPTAGAAVKVKVAGKQMPLTAGEGGVFTTTGVVLPSEGAHTVDIIVTVDGESATYSATLNATCTKGGAAGAACCAPDACAAGLTCVFGACAAAPAADLARCHGEAECASGVCGDGTCNAPTCEDKVVNGGEAAVDCGGSCGGCPTGTACKLDTDCSGGVCALGICPLDAGKLIGEGDGSANTAKLTTILSQDMKAPTDLAFSTLDPNQLWIVDAPVDSFIVVFGAGKEGQSHNVLRDFSQHFMEEVMAISFADEPSFGTCGDSRNDYGGQAKPNNFMGPVQWPSKFNDYTKVNSAHSVHWDMLHSSPNCMGMASAGGTAYFMFNGYNNAIDWVDFKKPHCPGCDDHSDGVKRRFAGVKVKRVANIPSNLVYDKKTSWVYVADTGNGRVLRLDVRNSYAVKKIPAFFGDGTLTEFSKPVVEELNTSDLKQPSGLALDRGVLYVGDAATGMITAWQVADAGTSGSFGKKLATFKTGFAAGSLAGMTIGPDKKLYAIDRAGKKVVRVDP
ncbi:MAG: hypothetical protein KC502_00080 [Myxococcales bacterium]|nr:hypothetical protein [Myxococcales bacterium]